VGSVTKYFHGGKINYKSVLFKTILNSTKSYST
jgi:hypothetical protein